MKKIEIDCFEVTEPDGAGMHNLHVAYASSKTVADAIAQSNNGWPGYVNAYKKTIVIVDSVDEYRQLRADGKREAALAKLTEDDKKALGL